MARKTDKMKSEMVGEVLSPTELENYMYEYEFVLIGSDEDDIKQKFNNYLNLASYH